MASLLTDNFNRADSASVIGSPTTGGPYTARVGVFGINGNRAYTASSTANAHLTFPAAANVDIQATFPVAINGAGLIARWVDASNFWYMGPSGTNWALFRNAGGSFISLVVGPPIANGDVARFVVYGRYLAGFVNGVQVLWWEDQTYVASTSAVAGLRCSSASTARFDDLSVSDAVSAPGLALGGKLINLDDMLMLDIEPIPPKDGWLYRGRDTKTADAGKA